MRTFWLQLVLPVALASAPAWAGVVYTADARLAGDVAFADGGVTVAGRAVPWDAVLAVLPNGRVPGPLTGGAVRWTSGEVWRAELVGLAAGRLTVAFGPFGRHELDVKQAAALDFISVAGLPDRPAPGTLYRDQGEPIPGTLLWVDGSRLAIDSPLGILTLPRLGTLRYVFPAATGKAPAAGAAGGADEVGLTDGSLLRGTVRPTAGGLQLEHPILGTLKLEAGSIRFVARLAGRAWDLTTLAPQSVTAIGPLGKAAKGTTVACRRAGDGAAGPGEGLAALVVQPKTALRYRLDMAKGGALALRVRIAPVDDAQGDVRLRIVSGGKTLLEKDVAPGAAPADVAVDVPAGGDLTLEVDFGRRIGFPCGVVLEDPLLTARG